MRAASFVLLTNASPKSRVVVTMVTRIIELQLK